MSVELIQFNSGEHLLGGINISEAVCTEGDIVFNESYTVVGVTLEGAHIHATYDLRVIGSIRAGAITVNGSMTVDGDVEADTIVCRGKFICTGTVKAASIEFGNFACANSLVCKELRASGNIFIHTTIDTDTLLEVDGLVVAGEGVLGDGTFKAKATIANEYYEFIGDCESNVFEISTMSFAVEHHQEIVTPPQDDLQHISIDTAITTFNDVCSKTFEQWNDLEESDLIDQVHLMISKLPDIHPVGEIIELISDLSYQREISNFRDYFYVLYAKKVFPQNLANYETMAPVLNEMFNTAKQKVNDMPFKATDITDFARSIYILSKYYSDLPISLEDGADKIFSSIGIRFSTVEHAWRTQNGRL